MEKWSDPTSSADTFMKFYFFDVVNHDEVMNGAKPVLVERGPYVYKYGVITVLLILLFFSIYLQNRITSAHQF